MDSSLSREEMPDGERLAHAARLFIGAPFRLHGRNPSTGLDCVGLVCKSMEAIGKKPEAIRGYQLRNSSVGAFLKHAKASGLSEVSGSILPGDILLISPGAAQHHLMIAETKQSFIHAHAGLKQVVRQDFDMSLITQITHWRLLSA